MDKEVCRKIQAAIEEYDKFLTLIKKGKLRWFDHDSRSSRLAKAPLQGTVKGKRIGGQKNRWEDNIKEWIGMESVSSSRQLKAGQGGKGLLHIHHSVVAQ